MIADEQLNGLVAWLADAGLAGQSELMLMTGFCERVVAAGLPLARAHLLIDTLDPYMKVACSDGGSSPTRRPSRTTAVPVRWPDPPHPARL
jgi:hypothetical protein